MTAAPFFWPNILQFVEGGHVVPIVGPELLRVGFPEGADLLYRHVAGRLAVYLGLDSAKHDFTSLNEVACHYLAAGGELEDIYSALMSIVPGLVQNLPLPEPLIQLASIRPLKLFITTTFDPLLEMALNKVRFDGQPGTRSIAYAPTRVSDLPCEAQLLDAPVVYHLFGRISAVPDYAVTDEDTLEFLHSLQSETRRPRLLFDELAKQHLLILGSGFPDWLARFFIRVSSPARLWQIRGKTDVLADEGVRGNSDLLTFLRHFSSRTRVYPDGDAVRFVRELHEHWQVREPSPVSLPLEAPEPTRGMAEGGIFISYASEDFAAAETIQKALREAGMDAWLDTRELRPGDPYEERIRSYIEKACVFLPVLSQHCLTAQRRFFRLEWEHAERVASMSAPSTRFIIPVAVDNISYSDERVPERFRKLHWERFPGRPPDEFIQTVKQVYRSYQRAMSRTV